MVVMRATIALGLATVVGLSGPAFAQRSLFDTPPANGAPVAAAPPAVQPAAPPAPTTRTQATAPAPEAAAPEAAPRRRARPRKPKGPVPARAVSIVNASANVLTSLTVSGDGKTAALKKPLKPQGRTSLKLPAMKSCDVEVASTFEGAPQPVTNSVDICKDKVLRLTD